MWVPAVFERRRARSHFHTLRCVGCAALLVSCGSESKQEDTGEVQQPETATFVLASLGFHSSPEEDGTTKGLDIDGTSDTVCGIEDRVAPDGREGIDNELAGLGPALEAFGAGSVRAIVQDAVNQGTLLVGVEIADIDDWQNDDSATMHVFLLEGSVDVGNNGVLEPNRSYWPRDYPSGNVADGRIEDGVFRVEGLEFTIPIQILGIDLDFEVNDGKAVLALDETNYGFFGDVAGGVPLEVMNELADDVVEASGGDVGLGELVRTAFSGKADLKPDDNGDCQQLSVGMEFEGVRAFIVPELAPSSAGKPGAEEDGGW